MPTEELLKRLTIDPAGVSRQAVHPRFTLSCADAAGADEPRNDRTEILSDYDDLDRDDLLAAVGYAARLSDVKPIVPAR